MLRNVLKSLLIITAVTTCLSFSSDSLAKGVCGTVLEEAQGVNFFLLGDLSLGQVATEYPELMEDIISSRNLSIDELKNYTFLKAKLQRNGAPFIVVLSEDEKLVELIHVRSGKSAYRNPSVAKAIGISANEVFETEGGDIWNLSYAFLFGSFVSRGGRVDTLERSQRLSDVNQGSMSVGEAATRYPVVVERLIRSHDLNLLQLSEYSFVDATLTRNGRKFVVVLTPDGDKVHDLIDVTTGQSYLLAHPIGGFSWRSTDYLEGDNGQTYALSSPFLFGTWVYPIEQ
ncbi:MAG: hypothetical protein HRT45_13545 [Bdellovibrionales bacterium]|nr:hypothetical protein [Bdellovibrionales bacterium]